MFLYDGAISNLMLHFHLSSFLLKVKLITLNLQFFYIF